MPIPSRKPLLGLVALSAALMMPLAFAQSATTAVQSQPTPPPAAATIAPVAANSNPTPSSDAMIAPTANTAVPPATDKAVATTGNKKTWSELDVDKDGKLSKAEAAADPGLMQIFVKADANSDGTLTPDEYKTYVAMNYPAKRGGHG